MHAQWVLYLQKFTFLFKHHLGKLNCAADASSRQVSLLVTLKAKITSFDNLKELYPEDSNFHEIWKNTLHMPIPRITLSKMAFFYGIRNYVFWIHPSKSISLRIFILEELQLMSEGIKP